MLRQALIGFFMRPYTDQWVWRGFWIALLAMMVVETGLFIVGASLHTPAAPLGIISFELAGTPERVRAILASWNTTARVDAAVDLGLDYLYIVTYVTTLIFGCLWVSRRFARVAGLGRVLVWMQAPAGLLDGVENVALYQELRDAPPELWAPLALVCAVLKFSLLLPAIAYVLVGLLAALGAKTFRLGTAAARTAARGNGAARRSS